MRWYALSFAVLFSLLAVSPSHSTPRQETSPTPPAFAPKYLEQIPLRYSDPTVVAKTLNENTLPPGVIRVQVDPKATRTLRVLGTQEGIATMRTIVSLLDVKPRQGTFRITVDRVRFAPNGQKYTTTVSKKILNLTHNIPASFSLTDSTGDTIAVAVTARLPHTKETSATLLAQFGWRSVKGSSVGLERAVPLPTGTASKRVMGLTFSDAADIIGTVGVGNTPAKWSGTFTAYYLAVQPVSVSR